MANEGGLSRKHRVRAGQAPICAICMSVIVTCVNVIVTPIEKCASAGLLANTGFGKEHLRCHKRVRNKSEMEAHDHASCRTFSFHPDLGVRAGRSCTESWRGRRLC